MIQLNDMAAAAPILESAIKEMSSLDNNLLKAAALIPAYQLLAQSQGSSNSQSILHNALDICDETVYCLFFFHFWLFLVVGI